MPAPKRIREKRNLTLNPEGVRKLRAVGASLPVPETNLSRLVDLAIAEFIAARPLQRGRASTKKK